MDWSNERYVRLYTRDTITWKRLRWEGQTVLMHVLRRLDRAGVLDLGGLKSEEALELVVDVPLDILREGLKKCLKLEVFVVDAGRIVMPNYLDAQEATLGNAERQRRYRAKLKSRDECVMSTPSNEIATPGNESNEAGNESNGVNTKVTPCLPSVPCLTNRAVPSYARAREGFEMPDLTRVSELIDRLNAEFSKALKVDYPGSLSAMDVNDTVPWAKRLLDWALKVTPTDPESVACKAWGRYLRVQKKAGKVPYFEFFAKDPAKYYGTKTVLDE